jgi:hypothetical protein
VLGYGIVVGVFEDRDEARAALRELRDAGFRENQIGVALRDGRRDPELGGTDVTNSRWKQGAAAGALTGAGLGGLWALAVAASILPPVGPVIAGGVLASLLAGAAGGAATGGIVGALIGLGIPESEAHCYAGEFHNGRTLVTVRPEGRSDLAASILRKHGALEKATTSESLPS